MFAALGGIIFSLRRILMILWILSCHQHIDAAQSFRTLQQDVVTEAPTSSDTSSAENNDTASLQSCEFFGLEKYFLIELQGQPDLLTDDDIIEMEIGFVESYNLRASDCLSMSSVTIYRDIFNGTGGASDGDDLTDPDIDLQPQEDAPIFSFLIKAIGNCTECRSSENFTFFRQYDDQIDDSTGIPSATQTPQEVNDADNDDNERRSLLKGSYKGPSSDTTNCNDEYRGLRALQDITLSDPCECPALLESSFVEQYKNRIEFSSVSPIISNVFNVTELDIIRPDCETGTDTVFQSTILVTASLDQEGETGEDVIQISEMTAEQRGDLERLFLESYNACNILNKDICDPFRRRIELVSTSLNNDVLDSSIIPGHDFNDNYIHLLFNVEGVCKDCASDEVLFDQEEDGFVHEAARQLRTQYDPSYLRQLQEEDPLECLCPLDVPSRSCSDEEFFEEYTAAMGTLSFASTLISVYELDITSCQNDPVSFAENVLLELTICQDEDFAEDLLVIEDAFVSVYNSLSMHYCDPHFRVVDRATVVDLDQVIRGGETILRIELLVGGSCRNNCDANTISIYDFPFLESFDSGRALMKRDLKIVDPTRRLQDVETCYCAAEPIGSRAPSESEFVTALGDYVLTISDQLSCVSSVGGCAFGTFFETVLVLTFENITLSNSQEISLFKSQIETAVLSSLEAFYEVNDLTCPLDVRIIDSVEAVLDIDVITPPREGTRGFDSVRLLQDDGSGGEISINETVLDDNFTTAPTTAPTFSPGESQDLSAAVFVAGYCDNCESDSLLVNDVTNRRLVESKNLHDFMENRNLQQQQDDPESFCFCPIGSAIVDQQPSFQQFEESVQSSLIDQGSTAVLVDASETDVQDCSLESSVCLSGRQSFICTDESPFEAIVIIDLQYNCDVAPDLLASSSIEYQEIANEYVERYNALQNNYCDTQQKTLTSAEVIQVGNPSLTSSGTSELAVVIRLAGTCRNCEDGRSVDVYEFPPAPTLEATIQTVRQLKYQRNTRKLQNNNVCECSAIGVSDNGFTEAEFTTYFRAGVENLGLQCFVSAGPCDFGTPFSTSLVLQTAPGSTVDTDVLQDEFLERLRATFSTSEDICNPDNPQYTEALAQLDFIFNGRLITTNNGQRILSSHKGRLLQGNQTTNSTAGDTASPTASPTFFTESENNETLVLLTVAGVCDGCEAGFALSNDVVRRVLGSNGSELVPSFRLLQEQTQGNCACLPDTPLLGEVSGGQFFEGIASVEVEAFEILRNINCSLDERSLAGKSVTVQFRANGAIPQGNYKGELERLANYLAGAYEEASQSVCDPSVQKITAFAVGSFVTPSPGSACQQYSANFVVTQGTCLGCDPQSTDLFGGGTAADAGRRLDTTVSDLHYRSLSYPLVPRNLQTVLTSAGCVCTDGLPLSAPNRGSWEAAVNQRVASDSSFVSIGCDCAFDPGITPVNFDFSLGVVCAGECTSVDSIAESAALTVCSELEAACAAECLSVQAQSSTISNNRRLQNDPPSNQAVVTLSLSLRLGTPQTRTTQGVIETKTCREMNQNGVVCVDTVTLPPIPAPTFAPTSIPTSSPTDSPTDSPTNTPTTIPTALPTPSPTPLPTLPPIPAATTVAPTPRPTLTPTTVAPIPQPTLVPTPQPTNAPSSTPTELPCQILPNDSRPRILQTGFPCGQQSCYGFCNTECGAIAFPTVEGCEAECDRCGYTRLPTSSPSFFPTSSPTQSPSKLPTSSPTNQPTSVPSSSPSEEPCRINQFINDGILFFGPEFSCSDRYCCDYCKIPCAAGDFSSIADCEAECIRCEFASVCTTEPTSSPSSPPTSAPTSLPSESPTSSPSKSPTISPTQLECPQFESSCVFFENCCGDCIACNGGIQYPHDIEKCQLACEVGCGDPACTNPPTSSPTTSPTSSPTDQPTRFPTEIPTASPTGFCSLYGSNGIDECCEICDAECGTGFFAENKEGCKDACANACGLGPCPTKSPTQSPTSSPTEPPTKNPTDTPTIQCPVQDCGLGDCCSNCGECGYRIPNCLELCEACGEGPCTR